MPGRQVTLSAEQLAALCQRSNAKGLARLAAHLLLLLATGYGLWRSQDMGWVCGTLFLHGTVLVFLFAPAHETAHRTAFKSRWLNIVVSHCCGFLLVLPAQGFRLFHLAHHRHTQIPGLDPELEASKPTSLMHYGWLMSGLPYWWGQWRALFRHASNRISEPYIHRQEQRALAWEARAYLAVYTALMLSALSAPAIAYWLLLFWWLPAVVCMPMLRMFLLAEHTGCAQVPDMLRNSRTTLSNPLIRWLCWNMNYHAEHHAYAAIAFFALPEAHAALGPGIHTKSPGYWRFHRDRQWLGRQQRERNSANL